MAAVRDMPYDDNDLELRDVRQGATWARAQILKHAEGNLMRSRDEPRGDVDGDARWKKRALSLVENSSFKRNPRKRALWRTLINASHVPAVGADTLDGNTAFNRVSKANATVEHIILAFMTKMVEDSDRRAARVDLNNASIRQGTKRMDEFLEQDFDPAVRVANLEDSQYCEKLIEAINDCIHKKLAKANYRGLASDLRHEFGASKWEVAPADARAKAIEFDMKKLAVATDAPFYLDDYLIPEEKAAAVTEEAVAIAKVAAVQKESAEAVADLEKRVNQRFEKVEAKVESVDTEVKEVKSQIGELLKAFTAGQEKMTNHFEVMNSKIDGIRSGSGRPRRKCSHCGKNGHSEEKCWQLHPELRPGGWDE